MFTKSTKPQAFFIFTSFKNKVHVTEALTEATFTETPVAPHVGLFTVNDEVFSPSTLTFQSIVTVSSTPAVIEIHPVSNFKTSTGLNGFSSNQWIDIGTGVGGTF